MNIEQEKMIVEALPSLYPLQEFEEKAIQTILDALPPAEHGTNLASLGTDCISREQAIKAIEEEWDGCCSEYPATQIIYDTTEAIERLPIIQPKRGRWIDKGVCTYVDNCRHLYKCDQCGGGWLDTPDFCPNCGAKMEVTT